MTLTWPGAKQEKAAFEAQGGTYTLTILPFDDPGTAIKSGADDAYSSLRSTLDRHAHTCAELGGGFRAAAAVGLGTHGGISVMRLEDYLAQNHTAERE